LNDRSRSALLVATHAANATKLSRSESCNCLPLNPSGYVCGKYFVVISPETKRFSVIISLNNGMLFVTP